MEPSTTPPVRPAQWKLFSAILIAMLMATIAGWIAKEGYGEGTNFWQSGIYFIVIPGSTAALLAILPSQQQNTTFGLTKGTTIAVLCSAIVLREGFICVVMALPLIIPVISLVSYSIRKSRTQHHLLMLPLLLLGLGAEGALYDLPNAIVVQETRVIQADSESLVASLERPARLPDINPLLFKLPFPLPTEFTAEGASLGDTRIIKFGESGSFSLEITERTSNSITWTVVENNTPIADWMTLREFEATWSETSEGLELTMTITFDRALSPAFYFDPLQRWGVGEMAEVLLDMIETNLQTTA